MATAEHEAKRDLLSRGPCETARLHTHEAGLPRLEHRANLNKSLWVTLRET